ncbi:ribulose bisphosphate carboxylase small subunit [Phormidesmis priestleyi]|uniref:ribulose bisphosphate carboxylase small subunit n=1 Tax=Phormidesmis priestleyi TaxID=268141 RepID=UPI00083A8CD6|nr:ribulose bisphosphate carboxylase small subunit [Phormidesmis priestleyi]
MNYYISPRFIDKLSVHITKNYLNIPSVKVPLILGVHGRKGEGKSFQCELVFERMGVEAVYMSAGELESPDAGDPARLIRLRYREAADIVKVRGKMAVLMINDIDAGAGRVDQFTQYTVNTQLVHGTLMNIADNPTNVQLPGSYEIEPIQRIPIIVTGNDLGTLYAPLTRDGRMEKFFWEPDRDDRIGIVSGIFEVDHIARRDIEQLVDSFPDQSIDFYGALRSRLYDEQVRKLIQDVGLDRISMRVVNSAEAPPEFHKPDFTLSHLLELGQLMVGEQKRLKEMRLVDEYNRVIGNRKLGEVNMMPTALTPAKSNGHTPPASSSYSGQPSSTRLNPEMVSELNRILGQGHRLGIEYVDDRRFRNNSWSCYGTFQTDGAKAIAALESCLADHTQDYVRLVGIDSRDRRRVIETIVQRPNGKHA